jgi:hypothetical protein
VPAYDWNGEYWPLNLAGYIPWGSKIYFDPEGANETDPVGRWLGMTQLNYGYSSRTGKRRTSKDGKKDPSRIRFFSIVLVNWSNKPIEGTIWVDDIRRGKKTYTANHIRRAQNVL